MNQQLRVCRVFLGYTVEKVDARRWQWQELKLGLAKCLAARNNFARGGGVETGGLSATVTPELSALAPNLIFATTYKLLSNYNYLINQYPVILPLPSRTS